MHGMTGPRSRACAESRRGLGARILELWNPVAVEGNTLVVQLWKWGNYSPSYGNFKQK